MTLLELDQRVQREADIRLNDVIEYAIALVQEYEEKIIHDFLNQCSNKQPDTQCHKLVKKWEQTGILDGLSDHHKSRVATKLEVAALGMIAEAARGHQMTDEQISKVFVRIRRRFLQSIVMELT